MNFKRTCTVIAVEALACLSLAACGGGSASGPAADAPAAPMPASPAAPEQQGEAQHEAFMSKQAAARGSAAQPQGTAPAPGGASAAANEQVWIKVASQYQYFALPEPQIVRYGRDTRWVEKQMIGKRQYCGDTSFGSDPAPGQQKECRLKAAATTPPPVTPPTTPPSGAGLSPACAALYAGVPDFALDASRTGNAAIPALAKPGRGLAVAEPSYKTCLVRASDYLADAMGTRAYHAYARQQAFNADSSKYLLLQSDGYWSVFDARTHRLVKKLAPPAVNPYPQSDAAEVQWDATNPELLTFLPYLGIGMKMYELNIGTSQVRQLADLSARLKARWPEAAAMRTRSEGSPSKDGRYHCFMVSDSGWGTRGLFTWDRKNDVITGMHDTRNTPDHVSISPSGNYCVQSNFEPVNTVAFTRDFSSSKQIVRNTTHYDLALDANGDDVLVGVDPVSYPWGSANTEGDVFMYNLRTNARTNLGINAYAGGATAMHFSGRAFNQPGWVVMSTQAGTSARWFDQRVMAVELKPAPRVYNLAFHRTRYTGEATAPVASVNRDFTKVIFNSNWGSGADDTDAYIIELPASALNAATAVKAK